MLVLLGYCLMDTFFTISALLAFYKIHKIYQANDGISPVDVLKLYLWRFWRYAPLVYATFGLGVFVMPYFHGNPEDLAKSPIWYSF